MLEDLTGVPAPDPPDPLFDPYWQGTREHRIMMPRCADCRRTVWPPRHACPICHGTDLSWREQPTSGSLYSWTTVWKATAAGYTDVPYAVGLIELAGASARILGTVLTDDPESLSIGLTVRARFVAAGADGSFTLVQWEPDNERAVQHEARNDGAQSGVAQNGDAT